jgi:hypothetical protein
MNYLLVRTRLQAIIAAELIKHTYLPKPFGLIKLFQFTKNEDSPSVYEYYEKLAINASSSTDVIQRVGFFPMLFKLTAACWHSRLSGGAIYVAVLDSYALAIAVAFCPGCRVKTFDDGTANIEIRENSYHATAPLAGAGFKRRIIRILFPEGPSYYLRQKLLCHYTIFEGLPNIVPPTKLKYISVDWLRYLSDSDRKVLNGCCVCSLLLGTTYAESPESGNMKKLRDLTLTHCDLYIPHPRELIDFESTKILQATSPAEAIIAYLSFKKIRVFHFNSSALLTFRSNKNVEAHNLLLL